MVSVTKPNALWQTILLVLGMLATSLAQAALQAYVDHNPVAAGESFTLTLESSDDLSGAPDLTPLQQNFQILGQSRSSSFQFINGTSSHKQQWLITLMAKQSGSVLIPPLSVGGEHSAPLTLTVTSEPQQSASPQQGDLFLEVSATPQSLYAQQQLVYTVKLFHAVDLADGATLSEPKLPANEAIVEKLGDDRQYQTVRNGIRYGVVERSYAIYPQQSGSLTIPPLAFEGDIVESGGMVPFGFAPFANNTRHKRIVSKALTLSVKPQPAAFNGKQWLPARNLQLVEQWSQTPPSFTVGQPITRSVAVMADGLTAAQLPALSATTLDGVKQYPDQPALKDTRGKDGITGLRTEKVALIPTQPGTLTLPAIEIPWWNTATNQLEVARLPAHTFTIAPAANGATATTPAPSPLQVPTVPAATPDTINTAASLAANSAAPISAGIWPWLALLFGSGWFATALAWWRLARRAPREQKREIQDKTVPQVEKRLKASCLADDAAACSRELLAWASLHWPHQPPASLTALAERCEAPLANAITALDRARYASGDPPWQGASLWQLFQQHKPDKQRERKAEQGELRPLYSK